MTLNKINFKIAINQIRSNKFLYLPYILASSLMVYIFDLVYILRGQEFMESSRGGTTILQLLEIGQWTIALFSFIFLIYMTNSIIKSRYKEFGLLYSLGMDKKGLMSILLIENLIFASSAILLGSLLSLLTSPLFVNLIAKILDLNEEIIFDIELSNIVLGIEVFALIFIFISLISHFSIRKKNPLELSQKSKEGEAEPKVKVISFILGLLAIGAGYKIALGVDNFFQAFPMFFPAVALVIIGTSFFFQSIVIWLLKLLRKNKKIYYKGVNMTFIGELIKRSKESAQALSTITIISSMFLLSFVVMAAMFIGKNAWLDRMNPADYVISSETYDPVFDSYIKEAIENTKNQTGIRTGEIKTIESMISFGKDTSQGDFDIAKPDDINIVGTLSDDRARTINIVDEESFNRSTQNTYKLSDGEVLIFDSENEKYESISIGGMKFTVKENLSKINPILVDSTMSLFHNVLLVVKDIDDFNENFSQNQNIEFGHIYKTYFDLEDRSMDDAFNFSAKLAQNLERDNDLIEKLRINNGIENRYEFDSMHTGAYITIIILLILFMASIIVVIYYKQAAEGLSDGRSIEILRKIGMSNKEIKKSINRQNYYTFFIPLLVSIIHILVASKIAHKLLQVFINLSRADFIKIEIGAILVYILVYILIFKITTPIYFKMGNMNKN